MHIVLVYICGLGDLKVAFASLASRRILGRRQRDEEGGKRAHLPRTAGERERNKALE